jgi:hypothetical protein
MEVRIGMETRTLTIAFAWLKFTFILLWIIWLEFGEFTESSYFPMLILAA